MPLQEQTQTRALLPRRVGDSGQPLGALDRAMLAVDGTVRAAGYPGFVTQMFVWLSGRADVPRLQTALARLSLAYPVITARLDTADSRGPRWQFQPGAAASLQEISLTARTTDIPVHSTNEDGQESPSHGS